LPQLEARLAPLENEEQERQMREIEAEEQLRAERFRLGELQDQLERLERSLDSS